MVARLVRDQKVVGSSPVTSTINTAKPVGFAVFIFCRMMGDLTIFGLD